MHNHETKAVSQYQMVLKRRDTHSAAILELSATSLLYTAGPEMPLMLEMSVVISRR